MRIRYYSGIIAELTCLGVFDLQNFPFFIQLEATVVEMQDTKSGVKGAEQKLNVTTIPHVITGNTKTWKQIIPDITQAFLILIF